MSHGGYSGDGGAGEQPVTTGDGPVAGQVARAAVGCPLAAWGWRDSWVCEAAWGIRGAGGGTQGAGGGIVLPQTLSSPVGNLGLSALVWRVVASHLGAGAQLRRGPQLQTPISNPGALRGAEGPIARAALVVPSAVTQRHSWGQ